MKKYIVILFMVVFTTACAQQSNSIVIGTIDSIHSKILNENRKIWVHVPDSDPNSFYSKDHYPVVYLLDGDAHFYSVTGMMQQFSDVNGNTVSPKMIIVGIPNTDRTRDLTPSHSINSPMGGGDFDKTSGGGENFTAFLEKELIPYIDSHYPTAPYRMLIGHSLGGILVMNTLINHTELFNSYLTIDPSMWWDDKKLLKQAATVLSQKDFNGRSLFLGIANTMPDGMDTLKVRKDTAQFSIHIKSILELADLLKTSQPKGLRWKYKYYNDEDHGSVPLMAENDALRFFFSANKMTFAQYLFDPSWKGNADSAINSHYKNVSAQMGYTVLPPESLINGLGYNYLQGKMFDRAFSMFSMNIRNYPKSFNVYDSMGDFYEAKGDNAKAIELFTKALTLRDFPDTRQKLEKLKAKK